MKKKREQDFHMQQVKVFRSKPVQDFIKAHTELDDQAFQRAIAHSDLTDDQKLAIAHVINFVGA